MYEYFLDWVNEVKISFDNNDFDPFDDLIKRAMENRPRHYILNKKIRTINDLPKLDFFEKPTSPILLQSPLSLGKMCVIPVTEQSMITVMGDTHGILTLFPISC